MTSSSSSSSGDASTISDAAAPCDSFMVGGGERRCATFDGLALESERAGIADGGTALQIFEGLGPLELDGVSSLFRVVAGDAFSPPHVGRFKLDVDDATRTSARLVTYREQSFDRVSVETAFRFVGPLPSTSVSVLSLSLRCLGTCESASSPNTFSLALSYDAAAGWSAYRTSTGGDGGAVVAGNLTPIVTPQAQPKPDQWRRVSVVLSRVGTGFTAHIDGTKVFEIGPSELQIPVPRFTEQTQVRAMVGLGSYVNAAPGDRPPVEAEYDDVVVDFARAP